MRRARLTRSCHHDFGVTLDAGDVQLDFVEQPAKSNIFNTKLSHFDYKIDHLTTRPSLGRARDDRRLNAKNHSILMQTTLSFYAKTTQF